MAARDELRAGFLPLAGSRIVVLDVTGVSYADSTALSEMIRFRKALLAAGGSEVRFVGPGSSFERILQLTDLTKVFPVFASVDDALADAGL